MRVLSGRYAASFSDLSRNVDRNVCASACVSRVEEWNTEVGRGFRPAEFILTISRMVSVARSGSGNNGGAGAQIENMLLKVQCWLKGAFFNICCNLLP